MSYSIEGQQVAVTKQTEPCVGCLPTAVAIFPHPAPSLILCRTIDVHPEFCLQDHAVTATVPAALLFPSSDIVSYSSWHFPSCIFLCCQELALLLHSCSHSAVLLLWQQWLGVSMILGFKSFRLLQNPSWRS